MLGLYLNVGDFEGLMRIVERTEKPRVGGSIPTLVTNQINSYC